MQDVIFREYDIRGKVGSELIIENTADLTRAIITFLKQKNTQLKTVVIGMDGRISSPEIKERAIAALLELGLNVTFIGICPSPVVYFALAAYHFDVGLMITASHNPKEYNGIKICLGTKTIWGKDIQKIKTIYQSKEFAKNEEQPGIYNSIDMIGNYVHWLSNHFPLLHDLPLSVAIDCGNGTAGTVIPDLIEIMQWKNSTVLCQEVDGNYPNHEADPTVYKNMQDVKKAMDAHTIQIGIGFDGDCDRMAAMTPDGFLIPGDQLLAIFAQDVLQNYPKSPVVFDIKASSALIELLQKWQATPIMGPCGHAIIKQIMDENHALVGGELSCHFFFKDRHFGFDDGIYAMMRLLEIVVKTGKSLNELLLIIPKKYSSPEIRIPCKEEKKQEIIQQVKQIFEQAKDATINTLDGVRVDTPYGWGNVRASNTQPVLSIRFEADSPENLKKIKADFVKGMIDFYDFDYLNKYLEI